MGPLWMGHWHEHRAHCQGLLNFKDVRIFRLAKQRRVDRLCTAAADVSDLREMQINWTGAEMVLDTERRLAFHGWQNHKECLWWRYGAVVGRVLERAPHR